MYCLSGEAFVKPSHWSDEKTFEGRAFFDLSTCPASLFIDTVQYEDEGTYKCRVDFKIQPTVISYAKLTVIGTV